MPKCKDCQTSFGFMELKNSLCKSCTNKKTPPCTGCTKNFLPDELKDGFCLTCYEKEQKKLEAQSDQVKKRELESLSRDKLDSIILTTETAHNLDVTKRIDIISAECVYGMNVFKDIASGIRDIVGGRNNSTQNVLRDARKTVLSELKKEAHSLGANAVVGVDLDYSEFSGGGKSMLIVVATGTAVEAKL